MCLRLHLDLLIVQDGTGRLLAFVRRGTVIVRRRGSGCGRGGRHRFVLIVVRVVVVISGGIVVIIIIIVLARHHHQLLVVLVDVLLVLCVVNQQLVPLTFTFAVPVSSSTTSYSSSSNTSGHRTGHGLRNRISDRVDGGELSLGKVLLVLRVVQHGLAGAVDLVLGRRLTGTLAVAINSGAVVSERTRIVQAPQGGSGSSSCGHSGGCGRCRADRRLCGCIALQRW